MKLYFDKGISLREKIQQSHWGRFFFGKKVIFYMALTYSFKNFTRIGGRYLFFWANIIASKRLDLKNKMWTASTFYSMM